MNTGSAPRRRRGKDAFAKIALWQFLAFVILLLLVWVNETLDLPALWFGAPSGTPHTFRGWALSIGVILTAIITAGITYEQQKRVLSGMLTLCAQCGRVRISQEAWAGLDDYVATHSLVVFTHGLCPECYSRACKEINAAGESRGRNTSP